MTIGRCLNEMFTNGSSMWLPALLLLLTAVSDGANILDLMGVASPSHHIWHVALVNALAARGHNVTVLSTDVDPLPPQNVTYVHMEGVYDLFYKEHDTNLVLLYNESATASVDTLWDFGLLSCEGCLRSNGVRQLLAYPDAFRFDLILYDYTLGPCLLGFQHKFKYPPVVGVTAFNIPTFTAEILGGHNYYAYVPLFALDYDPLTMTVGQRVKNIYLHIYDYICRNYYFMPTIHAMATKVFGNDLPYVGDLERHTKIALVNAHPVFDVPEPLPPNVIAVGGLQVRATANRLPGDLDAFISSAGRAAVLFSLGTNIRSAQLDVNKQLDLLRAFGRMPEYNFLWKFEKDDLLPANMIPPNVLIRPWLPQNDILAHPKVRAFITHAGTLSTHEATWHAVPMVAMPFFVDQVRTAARSVRDGCAERIHYEDLTAALVETKVRQVLEDPKYQRNMDRRSQRFRDQPETPLQRAVWWVEYVLRDPDPTHLQSPVRVIGPFVANLWDMWLLVWIVGVVIVVCVWRTIESCLSVSKQKLVLNSLKKRS